MTLSDTNRVCGVNVNSPDVTFTNGFLTRLIDKIFPITMPYLPGKAVECPQSALVTRCTVLPVIRTLAGFLLGLNSQLHFLGGPASTTSG